MYRSGDDNTEGGRCVDSDDDIDGLFTEAPHNLQVQTGQDDLCTLLKKDLESDGVGAGGI